MKICFSVITPSYNGLDLLKLQIKSVADQNCVHEHIVVDGKSNDGTINFLKKHDKVRSVIESDNGMYDAINKGILASKGDIILHLNCDEQLLPNVLEKVKEIFDTHPEVDIVHGDKINVYNSGDFSNLKRSMPFNYKHIIYCYNYIHTCATFYRRRIFENSNFFDLNYKYVGDTEFILRLHKMGYKSKYVKLPLSTFTISDANLSQTKEASLERIELMSKLNAIPFRFIHNIYRFRMYMYRLFNGYYIVNRRISYEIYTLDSPSRRNMFSRKVKFQSNWLSKNR